MSTWTKKAISGGLTDTSVNLTAKLSAMGVKVYDSFNRADSATTLGNADTGQAWTILNGIFGISSNQAYIVSGSGDLAAVVNPALSDGTLGHTLSLLGSTIRLIFRSSDTSNYFNFQASSSGYSLYRRVAGTFTQIGSYGTLPVQGDKMKVTINGSSITCYVNDVAVMTVTDTFNQTSTMHGFGITANVARVDEFYFQL
jgi:hypothetical protein